jgi:hypothetical protein
MPALRPLHETVWRKDLCRRLLPGMSQLEEDLARAAAADSSAAYKRYVAARASSEDIPGHDVSRVTAVPTTLRHGRIVLRDRPTASPPADPHVGAAAHAG